ncbi:TonB-dependent receptor [Flavobacterium rhizosphaerae]|uniref:TonB-dependent receptor n=1 Tax=Flavobacterium rhizosphaerae TaxID=3163298 RepID=A0ABW8Z0V5_9FLAO
MNKITRLFFMLFVLMCGTVMAQQTITGTVTDNEDLPLTGANISIQGTTDTATTSADGTFSVVTVKTSGNIIVSFVGYETKTISFTVTEGRAFDAGTIMLTSDAEELETVVIVGGGVIDLEEDRRTPVAVSTISQREIKLKSGQNDFTTVMQNTPSIYVASQAGGFGDTQMYVRGFDQTNTAFLLNGQPINGMEDGNMYWSNWSGMTDIANAVQVQRGLGSSKLAISSVGGTVNIVTKTTDMRKGGFAQSMIGNNNYQKTSLAYSTGLNEKGFGTSVMLSKWSGDGYNRGTYGEGYNYFLSFGYKPSDRHIFNFLIFGAPQWHDQNYTKAISNYLQWGRKYNNNYGFELGDYKTERRNYYHKPVANLNWDFNINSNMQLSTVLYASLGRGGGTGNYGSSRNRIREADGHIDFDAIRMNNQALAGGIGNYDNSYLIRNSVNNHIWYGVVSNFNHKITENFNYNIGLDIRNYKGTHYREVSDYLGLNGFEVEAGENAQHPQGFIVTEQYSANPWSAFKKGPADTQKIDYDYDERITYEGLFGQAEYATDIFSVFVQAAVSNQSHVRWDRWQYTKQEEESPKVNNTGYDVKGGASIEFVEGNTFFVNAGHYSRQPYHDNIYLSYGNDVNPFTKNEKITGIELGYRFRSTYFSADVNAYRTNWKDRVTTSTGADENGEEIFYINSGVNQLHKGLELEFKANPFTMVDIKGFASLGDWKYNDNIYKTTRDQNRNIIEESFDNVDGHEVGGGAQTTLGLGFVYRTNFGLSVDADWRYYDNLYSTYVGENENVKLPTYDLTDLGLTYRLNFAKTGLTFRVNVNNLFDEVYISQLTTANPVEDGDETYKGINVSNNGFFGNGRTWNFSMKFNF